MVKSTPQHRELARLMILTRLGAYGALLPSDLNEIDHSRGSVSISSAVETLVKDGFANRRSLRPTIAGNVLPDDCIKKDYILVLSDTGRQYLSEHQTDLERLHQQLGDVIETTPPVWWEWVMKGSAAQVHAAVSAPLESRLDTVAEVITAQSNTNEQSR